jgi:hypothetical protein
MFYDLRTLHNVLLSHKVNSSARQILQEPLPITQPPQRLPAERAAPCGASRGDAFLIPIHAIVDVPRGKVADWAETKHVV